MRLLTASRSPGALSGMLAILLLLAGTNAPARAAETLDTEYYTAPIGRDESLLAALNRATPIRQGGQVFHGYTRWHVDWRFYWESDAGGCRIVRAETSLRGNIQLPRIAGGTPAQQTAFATYAAALREHELGHYRIGQQAAAAIRARLRGHPPQPDCATLERSANAAAHETLQEHVRREREYDARTGHGRTQGAWLPR